MSREMVDSKIKWLGIIPSSWDIKPLGTYLKERKEKVSDIDYEPLSVTKNGIVPQLENAAKSDAHDDRKKVCKGDFVINSRSDRKQSCGLSQLDGSVSLINIVLENKNYFPNYLKYLLDNSMFAEEFYSNGHGIVADLWTTRYDEMRNIMLPIPSSNEQERIANYLDKKVKLIDETIENNKKEIELLEEYKLSVIEDVISMYETKEVKLKFLGNFQNGISAGTEKFGNGNGVFINYGDVYNNYVIPDVPEGKIDLTDIEIENYSLKYGDVLFTRTSETIEEVAISAVCLKNYPCSAFSGFVIRFRPNNINELLPEYSKYYFKLRKHRDYFAKEMNIVTRASLSQGLLGNLTVLLPTPENQRNISKKLDEIFCKIDNIKEYRINIIARLEEYKKSLIYEAVTGKIEV